MPSRDEHLERARQNEEFAGSLDIDRAIQADWAVTILFYSALHYVDAYLAVKSYHPPDHDARDSEIENNGSLADIYKDYRRLKDRSREARYNVANFHPDQFPPLKARFDRIKRHVLSKLR